MANKALLYAAIITYLASQTPAVLAGDKKEGPNSGSKLEQTISSSAPDAQYLPPSDEYLYDQILLKGGKKFYNKTVAALNFMKEKTPLEYTLLKKAMTQIVQENDKTATSGIIQSLKKCSINEADWDYSTEKYSCVLAHEAFHPFVNYLNKTVFGGKLNGWQEDLLTSNFELRYLQSINASGRLIRSVRNTINGYYPSEAKLPGQESNLLTQGYLAQFDPMLKKFIQDEEQKTGPELTRK